MRESPFEEWRLKNMNGMAASRDIMYLLALAFEGGRIAESELAKPEQEPVAWMYNGHLHECDPSDWALDDVIPLYTSPPRKEWIGLTDDELDEINGSPMNLEHSGLTKFARDIEVKLRSKNENS